MEFFILNLDLSIRGVKSKVQSIGDVMNYLKTWKFVISKLCNPYLV